MREAGLVPLIPSGVLSRVQKLNDRLDRQARLARRLSRYYDGSPEPPPAITQAKVTKAYRRLIPVAEAPWGSVVVDSIMDRVEISGIRTQNKQMDLDVWDGWQRNYLDSESKLANQSAFVAGRAYAIVWPDPDEPDNPRITFDTAEQVVIEYEDGDRHRRVAALRRWMENDRPLCTLYTKDAIYKFIGPKNSSGYQTTDWTPRIENGEDWPLVNSFKTVPVVDIAVNQQLKPGEWAHARGEFEHVIGLIDRINLLTFLGLVVAFYQGFPLRGLIGDRILTDDQGEPIAPFKALANEVFQIENPAGKIAEFRAAERGNLAVFDELSQLAMLTKTPRHYFPYSGGLSNISADAIRADEGGHSAKATAHKSLLGVKWFEVMRLWGMMRSPVVKLPASTTVLWKDHESRSLAERADAAVKLAPLLPWQVVAEMVLNAPQDEVRRWQKMRNDDAMAALLLAARKPLENQRPTDLANTATEQSAGGVHIPAGAGRVAVPSAA